MQLPDMTLAVDWDGRLQFKHIHLNRKYFKLNEFDKSMIDQIDMSIFSQSSQKHPHAINIV